MTSEDHSTNRGDNSASQANPSTRYWWRIVCASCKRVEERSPELTVLDGDRTIYTICDDCVPSKRCSECGDECSGSSRCGSCSMEEPCE
jgi:hypothetical protein